MPRPAPRHLLAPTLAAALALAACGPQEQATTPVAADTATPTTTAQPTPTSSATASPGPTASGSSVPVPSVGDASEDATPAEAESPADDDARDDTTGDADRQPGDQLATGGGDVPDLSDHCTVPVELPDVDRFEFTAPAGWRVGDTCEFFDPAREEVEEDTEPDVAVSVDVTDTPFHEAAAPGPETRDEVRYVGARSGYQAGRVRAEATGRGLYPKGTPRLLHLVDLDPGTDEDGGTLVLSAQPSSGADFALAAEALDRMASTVMVRPVAPDADGAVVITRTEGGGAPWTVTWQGECLRLHAGAPDGDVVDEACELGAAQDGIRAVVLGDDTLQVVAGFAPARSARVRSAAASAWYGAVTQPMEGSAGFAYTPIDTPVEVHAVDVAGDELATATIR